MYTYSALILDDEEFSVEVLIEDIAGRTAAFPRVKWRSIPSARPRNFCKKKSRKHSYL